MRDPFSTRYIRQGFGLQEQAPEVFFGKAGHFRVLHPDVRFVADGQPGGREVGAAQPHRFAVHYNQFLVHDLVVLHEADLNAAGRQRAGEIQHRALQERAGAGSEFRDEGDLDSLLRLLAQHVVELTQRAVEAFRHVVGGDQYALSRILDAFEQVGTEGRLRQKGGWRRKAGTGIRQASGRGGGP